MPALPLAPSAKDSPFVHLAAALNCTAYLNGRRKAASELLPNGDLPPHALHPEAVEMLIRAVHPARTRDQEVCRVLALLHDVIEDNVQQMARDPASLAASLHLFNPASLRASAAEDRVYEATALAHEKLNQLFAGLPGLPRGRGVGDLVLLASMPLLPEDAQLDFGSLGEQDCARKALRKAAFTVAQIARDRESGAIVAAVKVADAAETLDPLHILVGGKVEGGELLLVDEPLFAQKCERIAWALARRRYLVDELRSRFGLTSEQTAAFEAVWQHHTERLRSLDPQIEDRVHGLVAEIHAFARRNEPEIARQLDLYGERLLGSALVDR